MKKRVLSVPVEMFILRHHPFTRYVGIIDLSVYWPSVMIIRDAQWVAKYKKKYVYITIQKYRRMR